MTRIITLLTFFLYPIGCLSAEDNCFFIDENGVFKSVDSIEKIPENKRKSANCSKVKTKKAKTEKAPISSNSPQTSGSVKKLMLDILNSQKNSQPDLTVDRVKEVPKKYRAVRPDEVELSRSKRTIDLSSSLGRVKLSWDRSAEKYFGKAPERAVQSAMTAASRVLSLNSFPQKLKNAKYDWQVVIMDKVPSNVMINMQGRCHPAWMRPPADIYISAKDLATSCGNRKASLSNASDALQETLIHEIGHAIEFQFLGKGFSSRQRWHNEGYATWFESLGAKYITGSGVNRGEVRQRAKKAWNQNWTPEMFQGTSDDYARAYALIATIAEKKSILRLSDIYSKMAEGNISLIKAIEEEGGWSRKVLMKKTAENLGLAK